MVLHKAHREALKHLRDTVVRCLTEESAVKSAYRKAAPLVRRVVETEYPVKDMKVLLRYEAAERDDCIKLRMAHGAVQDVMFNFDDKNGPLVVRKTYSGKFFLADDATTEAVLSWRTAKEARDKTLSQKKRDYATLIEAARTLEEVEVLWPEAKQIREAFAKNQVALMALTPTVVQRIKQDVAERATVQQ
jgi:hypothetical protein